MKIKKELVLRKIMDEYYLVPVGETIYTHSGLFVMTEVAAQIWKILPKCDTVEEIIEDVMEIYDTTDTTKEQIAQDVEEFLKTLELIGILEKQ